MKDGDTLDEMFCPIDGLHFCEYTECGARCVGESEGLCPDAAAMAPVLERMDAADVLVFTTPTYCYHVSSQLKVLLEHVCWRWMRHRPNPAWFKKQALVIATAAGAGAKKPAADIVDSLNWLGAGRVCVVQQSMGAMDWNLATESKQTSLLNAARKAGGALVHDPTQVKPSIGVHGRFFLMRMLQKKFPTGDADQAFWIENGWLEGHGLPEATLKD